VTTEVSSARPGGLFAGAIRARQYDEEDRYGNGADAPPPPVARLHLPVSGFRSASTGWRAAANHLPGLRIPATAAERRMQERRDLIAKTVLPATRILVTSSDPEAPCALVAESLALVLAHGRGARAALRQVRLDPPRAWAQEAPGSPRGRRHAHAEEPRGRASQARVARDSRPDVVDRIEPTSGSIRPGELRAELLALEPSYPLVVMHGTARPGRAAWAELVSLATAVVIPVRDAGEAMTAVRTTLRSLQQMSDAASDLAAAVVVVALPGPHRGRFSKSPPPTAPPVGVVTVRCGTPDPTTLSDTPDWALAAAEVVVSLATSLTSPGSSGGPRC
jgi:hypothetical protein